MFVDSPLRVDRIGYDLQGQTQNDSDIQGQRLDGMGSLGSLYTDYGVDSRSSVIIFEVDRVYLNYTLPNLNYINDN